MTQNPHIKRIAAVQSRLGEGDYDAFVSVESADNAYLTGFFGSTSSLLIARDRALLLCDFRYIEQAVAQSAGVEVVECAGNVDLRLAEHLDALNVKKAAFEPDAIIVSRRDAIAAAFSGVLVAAPGLCRQLRETKEPDEIARMAAATALAEDALKSQLEQVREGMTERELAGAIEYAFRCRGAQRASFETIVLFGERSSLPHGMPGARALKPGDIVLVDCGCVLDGYCSDLTRTFVFGRIPGDWFVEIYECVRRAQQAAVDATRPGVAARAVDAAAREYIAGAGHGQRFGHGTGHGVGLEVHEAPRLNAQATAVLKPGMVVTVEPGVYLPGQGGVRIEDMIVVTDNGCKVLTQLPKELRIL